MNGAKALSQWEEILMPSEIEALHDNHITAPGEKLTANEVLDIIIEWEGGIATGYQLRSIVSRVYGIELGEAV